MTASWTTAKKNKRCPNRKHLLHQRCDKLPPYTSERTLNIDRKLGILADNNFSPIGYNASWRVFTVPVNDSAFESVNRIVVYLPY